MTPREISMPIPDLAQARLDDIIKMVTGPTPIKRCPHVTSPGAGYICHMDAPWDGVMCAECAHQHVDKDDRGMFTCDRCHLLNPATLRSASPDGVAEFMVPPCIEWLEDQPCDHWQGHLTVFGLWSLCRACSNLTTGAPLN